MAPSYHLSITLATGTGPQPEEWVELGEMCGPRAGRAGTATLCCLDAKVTSLIAH